MVETGTSNSPPAAGDGSYTNSKLNGGSTTTTSTTTTSADIDIKQLTNDEIDNYIIEEEEEEDIISSCSAPSSYPLTTRNRRHHAATILDSPSSSSSSTTTTTTTHTETELDNNITPEAFALENNVGRTRSKAFYGATRPPGLVGSPPLPSSPLSDHDTTSPPHTPPPSSPSIASSKSATSKTKNKGKSTSAPPSRTPSTSALPVTANTPNGREVNLPDHSFSGIAWPRTFSHWGKASTGHDGIVMGQSKRFLVGYADTIGRRPAMEDSMVVNGSFRGHSYEDYFAVFDGHGGKDAASFAANNLHTILAERMRADNPVRSLKDAFIETNKLIAEQVFIFSI
eukprot:TRINITY_DN3581_c0_g1_i2.p1 TRINITY_DN3581_c0_g1~~TRINITY_DN3581_c0_g1_i2.p1  ORF type:complete len:341 (+),score=92.77 TRINITY_DN3581_c0_g1_i2:197-1219(+)